MAGKITHAVFAEELINKSKLINVDMEYIKTYSILPDFFIKDKFNGCIHRTKVNKLFCNVFNYIIKNNLENDTEIRSMFYGLISHYILDSYVHPYIFYKTCYYDTTHNLFKYSKHHHKYESYIDIYFIDKHKLDKFYNYPFNIKISKSVSSLIDNVMYKTYRYKNASGGLKKGYRSAKVLFKYFKYDKYGIKKCIYKLFPKLLKYLSYNRKLNDNDIMNLSKNNWHNPVSNKKHNESFLDLYNNALNEGIKLILEVDACLKNKDSKKYKKIIGNNSYIHGLDCNKDHDMKYLKKIV